MCYCPIEEFNLIFQVLSLYSVVANYSCPVILVTIKNYNIKKELKLVGERQKS